MNSRGPPPLRKAESNTADFFNILLSLSECDTSQLESQKHRRDLAAGLVAQARQTQSRQPRVHRHTLAEMGIPGLEALTIYPNDEGTDVIVGRSVSGRGWTFVQECIDGKNKKVKGYRRRLPSGSELWLLLVSGSSFASGVEVPSPNIPFDTYFDRVFFLDHFPHPAGKQQDRVVELPVKR